MPPPPLYKTYKKTDVFFRKTSRREADVKNVRLSKKVKKGRRRGGGSNPLLFFHTGEKLCNMKYMCGKYLTITTVLKMHKFCHSGLKPFSNGKDV